MTRSAYGSVRNPLDSTCRRRFLRCGSSCLPAQARHRTGRGSSSRCSAALLVWLASGGIGLVKAQEAAEGRCGCQGRAPPRTRTQPAADAAPPRARPHPPQPEGRPLRPPEHAAVGDPGVGADRRVPAAPLDLFHRPGDPPVHGVSRQRGRARRPGREARGRDPRQEIPGCLRRLQGQRLLPGPAGAHRHRQPAQRPARGQGSHAARRPRRSSPAWR